MIAWSSMITKRTEKHANPTTSTSRNKMNCRVMFCMLCVISLLLLCNAMLNIIENNSLQFCTV